MKKIIKRAFIKIYIFLSIFIIIILFLKNNEINKESSNVMKNIIFFKEQSLEECLVDKPKLVGKMNIVTNISNEFKSIFFDNNAIKLGKQINESFVSNLKNGGSFQPKLMNSNKNCKMKSIAFIIPYKNRLDNLYVFLYNMHSYLQRQQLKYTIFVVEQINDSSFNKGILNNAGFNEIILNKNSFLKSDNDYFDYDCVMYHDVDLLPTDDLNLYSCPHEKPVHFSILVDNIDYNKCEYFKIYSCL
jgi:hypothetical protein